MFYLNFHWWNFTNQRFIILYLKLCINIWLNTTVWKLSLNSRKRNETDNIYNVYPACPGLVIRVPRSGLPLDSGVVLSFCLAIISCPRRNKQRELCLKNSPQLCCNNLILHVWGCCFFFCWLFFLMYNYHSKAIFCTNHTQEALRPYFNWLTSHHTVDYETTWSC